MAFALLADMKEEWNWWRKWSQMIRKTLTSFDSAAFSHILGHHHRKTWFIGNRPVLLSRTWQNKFLDVNITEKYFLRIGDFSRDCNGRFAFRCTVRATSTTEVFHLSQFRLIIEANTFLRILFISKWIWGWWMKVTSLVTTTTTALVRAAFCKL